MSRNIQEHILKTASELFYSHGIKATGIDAIVKATGVAKMSLYKYFPSKDALVLAHLHSRAESLRAHILSEMETKSSQPKLQMLAIFEIFEEIASTPGFRGCPFINAAAEFAEESNPIQQASAEFYQSLCGLLAKLGNQAGMADPEELSKQLAMLITGAIIKEQIQRHSGSMRTAHMAAQVLIENSLNNAANR